MKKLKTRNEYVGCNRKCRFYADEIKATSYGHWVFVMVVDGKVVFNNYNYSSTTSRHQSEIRWLLRELGIKVDITVNFRDSLTEYNVKSQGLKAYYRTAIAKIVENHTPRIRKTTKEKNKSTIQYCKDRIKALREIDATYTKKDMIEEYRRYKGYRDDKEDFIKDVRKNYKGKVYKNKDGDLLKVVGTKDSHIKLKYLEPIKRYWDTITHETYTMRYFNQYLEHVPMYDSKLYGAMHK